MTDQPTPKCARCGHGFVRKKLMQKFCSQRCQRSDMKRRRRLRRGPELVSCDNPECGKQFQRRSPKHRFCCNRCRYRGFRGRQPPKPRKSLRCKWCRGKHLTSACPNPTGVVVKQYGSLGPNREYIPPPGVKVRYVQVTYDTFGDKLTKILKELDP